MQMGRKLSAISRVLSGGLSEPGEATTGHGEDSLNPVRRVAESTEAQPGCAKPYICKEL